MRIDSHSGTVELPNGYSVDPGLSQDGFRAGAMSPHARSEDRGTLPWIHYHFSGGRLEGRELLVSLCFYDQLLVQMSITADLYPPGPRDWSNYSLDVEAATKAFHDRILEATVGEPTRSEHLFGIDLPATQATLARPLAWDFPWGRVTSGHDSRGGGTYITVSYGNRHEEASTAYRRARD
jgi:hypothetical protein